MGECVNAKSECMCYSRVYCCMAPLARVRPCWPGQWPTTQTAPSSGSLAVSWCRSTLGRAVAWSESSLSWPGEPRVYIIDSNLCACSVAWPDSCLSFPVSPHIFGISFSYVFASMHDEIYNLCNRQSRPVCGQTGLLSFFDIMMFLLRTQERCSDA